jgi:HK97 family phage prohead protease
MKREKPEDKGYAHFKASFKKADDDGGYDWTLSTAAKDRHGDVVVSKGMRLPKGLKTIPLLWLHGFDETRGHLPIGQLPTKFIEKSDDAVTGKVFFDEENDPFAQMVREKVDNKSLSSGSIGFQALDWSWEKDEDDSSFFQIDKWELFEFSIVPVPANAGALRKNAQLLTGAFEYLKQFKAEEQHKSEPYDVNESVPRLQNAAQVLKNFVQSEDVELKTNHIDLIKHTIDALSPLVGVQLVDDKAEPESNQPDQEKAVFDLGAAVSDLQSVIAGY